MLASLAGWSEVRLAYRPANNAWSAIEMLDHIVKVESEITAATRKGLQKPHQLSARDRLGFLFLDRIFRSKLRVKVPGSARNVLPDLSPNVGVVVQRWDLGRRELAQLVANVDPDQLDAGVFRHPVSGWMSLPQVLRFFSAHIQHHGFQLARIRGASEKQG